MNLENWINQAIVAAGEVAKSPIGAKVKDRVEKGVAAATAASQNIPSQEQIALMLEGKSPQLAQAFLSYASDVSNPHQVGMGMKILSLSDDGIRVQLPHRWRNRTFSGAIHAGALMTLAEFTGRSYWERLIDQRLGEVRLREVQATYHNSSFRNVVAQFNLAGEERERVLFNLRKQGKMEVDTMVIVFGKGDQRIADFSMVWEIDLMPTLQEPEVSN